MKKLIVFLLAMILVFSFAACDKKEGEHSSSSNTPSYDPNEGNANIHRELLKDLDKSKKEELPVEDEKGRTAYFVPDKKDNKAGTAVIIDGDTETPLGTVIAPGEKFEKPEFFSIECDPDNEGKEIIFIYKFSPNYNEYRIGVYINPDKVLHAYVEIKDSEIRFGEREDGKIDLFILPDSLPGQEYHVGVLEMIQEIGQYHLAFFINEELPAEIKGFVQP